MVAGTFAPPSPDAAPAVTLPDEAAYAPPAVRKVLAVTAVGVLLALLGTSGFAAYLLIASAARAPGQPHRPAAVEQVAALPKATEPPEAKPAPVSPPKAPAVVKPAVEDKPAPPQFQPSPLLAPPPAKVKKADPDDVPPPVKKAEPPKAEAKPPAPEVAKAPEEEQPKSLPKLQVKRRSTLTAEDLRKQLLLATEIALDAPHAPATSKWLLQAAREKNAEGFDLAPLLMQRRPDLAGLPMSMGVVCRLGKEPAEALQALSRKLRTHLEACVPVAANGTVADPRPDPDRLRTRLTGDAERAAWLRPEAIPTLLQLLMPENADVRRILVEVLSQIPGRDTSAALAQRALFDLDQGVRAAALEALRPRSREEYEGILLSGFQYPWAAVADHAAEALVALGLRECVPRLVTLLDGKDVSRPFTIDVGKGRRLTVVQELVRVNHLGNCLMCHAPSQIRTDLVRGRVPIPGEPLPAPVTTPKYYEGDRGTFVRADITYLKQDFSVYQPVLQAGTWPGHQRYDYLVRRRPLTPQEVALWHKEARTLDPISPRKQALMFALRELTRKDPGPRAEDWKRLYCAITGEPLAKPLSPAEQVTRLKTALVNAAPARQEELLEGFKERDGAAYDLALVEALAELPARLQRKGRAVLRERMVWLPLRELRGRLREPHGEIRQAALRACAEKDLPVLIEDVKGHLQDSDPAVVQAANEALCRLDPSYAPLRETQRLRTDLVDAVEETREEILESYRTGKGKVFSQALARAIPDLPKDIQKKARAALAERVGLEPLAGLRERLKDADKEIRLAAVRASQRKRVRSLVPDLIPRLDDEDATIIWHARQALRELTGQDIGPQIGASAAERARAVQFWHEWWEKHGKKQ